MPRHYIVVTSPDNYRKTQGLKFAKHGLKARRRKTAEGFAAGDHLLFYLTGDKTFAASCTITGPAYEEHTKIWIAKEPTEDYPNRFPLAPDCCLAVEHAIEVEPLVPDLEHLKRWPGNWHLGFQGNIHEINEHDFKLIRSKLAAQAKKKGVVAGKV